MCLKLPPKSTSHWMAFYSVGHTSLYCQLSIVWEREKQNWRKTEPNPETENERQRDKELNREWSERWRSEGDNAEIGMWRTLRIPTVPCSGHQTGSRIKASLPDVQKPSGENGGLWQISFKPHSHTASPAPISSLVNEIWLSLKPKSHIVNKNTERHNFIKDQEVLWR